MKSGQSSSSSHILAIPFPAHGHILPFIDLIHQLLSHDSSGRLTITIVITPKNLEFLKPILSHHPSTSLSPLILPFPTHPSIPAGVENTADLPPSSFHSIISALTALKTPLLRWFATHPSPPSAIISDYVAHWTHSLAAEMGIKRFVYSPGAFSVGAAYTVRRRFPPMPRLQNGEFDEDAVVTVQDLPCKSEFTCWEMLPLYRAFGCTEDNHDGWRREVLTSNINSSGFIFNTFHAIDSVYLDQMKEIAGHDRVWGVGPLLPPDNEVGYGPKVRGGSGPAEEILSWLDACADGEVVYVSFGALVMPTQQQIDILASALDKSGVKFLWKIKEGLVDDQTSGKLPPAYQDRVAGRGLIITEWAPQVLILRHKAVGSFLTHCGWNAVVEALSAGVAPLITWPLVGDQLYNSKVVVEKLKVGVLVGQGIMSKLIPDPNELAKILVDSVSGGFKEEKARALDVKKEALKAISQGGTSFNELDMFIQHLIQLPKPDPDVIHQCQKLIEEQDVVEAS